MLRGLSHLCMKPLCCAPLPGVKCDIRAQVQPITNDVFRACFAPATRWRRYYVYAMLQAKMADPSAVKPDDWDEDLPQNIVDEV